MAAPPAAPFYNSSGTVTITNSTFYGNNDSSFGSAIANYDTLTVINSTFAGNTGGFENGGGAIYNAGSSTATVAFSTFYSNSSEDNASGIVNSGTLNLMGAILAESEINSNCNGSINDEGYNLSDDDSCNFTATGSQNNVSDTDLKLDSNGLQNNGGPTNTVALEAGSLRDRHHPAGRLHLPEDQPVSQSSDDFGFGSADLRPARRSAPRQRRQLRCRCLPIPIHADRYSHGDRDGNFNADSHCDSHRDRHIDPNCDRNRDGHCHPNYHRNRNGHSDRDRNRNRHGNCHSNCDRDRHSDPDCDRNQNCDANSHSYADRNQDRDANSYRNTNQNCDANSYRNGDPNQDCNSYGHSNCHRDADGQFHHHGDPACGNCHPGVLGTFLLQLNW